MRSLPVFHTVEKQRTQEKSAHSPLPQSHSILGIEAKISEISEGPVSQLGTFFYLPWLVRVSAEPLS